MEYELHQDPARHDLLAQLRLSAEEISSVNHHVHDYLVRRLVDALYVELLPVVKASVLASIDKARLAEIIVGEISLAFKNL